ncbi:MAG TPA: hypothetical protein VFL60_02970 [Gaiellaceae bacterium]|nr:hypothetical protein [Gaiellaceae bacterium]
MARKSKQELAKQKAAKQKKIAIVGGVLLVALLAFQLPKTMKMLHPHPVVASSDTSTDPAATTPTVTPSDPNTLVAPTLAGAGTDTLQTATTSSDLVSAVPVTVDPGQLRTFEQFASKDPFAEQAPKDSSSGGSSAGAAGGKSGGSKGTPTKPQQGGASGSGSGSGATSGSGSPTAPPPPAGAGASTGSLSSAVISLNGELMSVAVNTDFPTSGTVFSRTGSVFHLVSVSAKSAKIAIAGGSYADGAATVTLQLKTPLTLQNTADGSKFTLILEPQGTAVPASTGGTASASAPTTTTPASAVPSGGGG